MKFTKPFLIFIIVIVSSYLIGLVFNSSKPLNSIKLDDTGIKNKREQNDDNKFNK